jgi:hypothetical protein
MFYTANLYNTGQKAKKLIFKIIKTKITPHSIKSTKIHTHLRLAIYLCDHFKVKKQWLEVE